LLVCHISAMATEAASLDLASCLKYLLHEHKKHSGERQTLSSLINDIHRLNHKYYTLSLWRTNKNLRNQRPLQIIPQQVYRIKY
jgi:hypothetical protein